MISQDSSRLSNFNYHGVRLELSSKLTLAAAYVWWAYKYETVALNSATNITTHS